MSIANLRKEYHHRLCEEIIRVRRSSRKGWEYPNFADGDNKASREIAWGIVNRFGYSPHDGPLAGQKAGGLFEVITKDFLEKAFDLIRHLRPGKWYYSTNTPISDFDQYEHLADLERIIKQAGELASSLGRDYIITPDIVIGRWAASDKEINRNEVVLGETPSIATLTPFRQTNSEQPRKLLHASISCKWTLRSDRSQNARTEALNLIRNRKGHLPHVVSVTAEPLPTRISSLALGTGDLDCVYHFALSELKEAILETGNEDQMDMLQMLIEGRRLRDISDLPFDLAT